MKEKSLNGQASQIAPTRKWKDSKAMPDHLGGVERTNRKRRITTKREQVDSYIAFRCDRLSRTERRALKKRMK